jgi:hypothetical protein
MEFKGISQEKEERICTWSLRNGFTIFIQKETGYVKTVKMLQYRRPEKTGHRKGSIGDVRLH